MIDVSMRQEGCVCVCGCVRRGGDAHCINVMLIHGILQLLAQARRLRFRRVERPLQPISISHSPSCCIDFCFQISCRTNRPIIQPGAQSVCLGASGIMLGCQCPSILIQGIDEGLH